MTKREAPGAGETGYPGDPERPMDAAGPGEAGDETPPTEARAASLLDRWQAHHDGQADADDQTDHAAAAGTPGTDDGEPAVEVTASPASPDLPDLPDLHQPAPSVADHVPEPDPAPAVPRISDLAEARARRAGPVEPEPEAVEPTPLRPAAAPSPEAVPEAVSEPEPEPAAQHPAAQDPAPRSVPRAGPDSGEIPVLGPDAEDPAPSPAALAKPSSGVRRPKHAAPRRAPLPSDRATDSVSASREVMDALAGGRDSDPAPDKPAPKHLARVRLTGREEDEAEAAAGVPGATTGRRR
ncbi:MAG: hypothetical protein OSB43_08700, partial [Nocardioides sp.]|nr:hypothetical protein [Nocardioides sp.]